MLSIMIVAEGYSVIGHIYAINYKQELPEIDCLKILMGKIADLFKGIAEDLTKKNK